MYNTDMPARADLPSSQQLIRSTLIALTTAIALLVTIVLPAEYGIDPTGFGRVVGLTKMGEIKQQLSQEALAEKKQADTSASTPHNTTAPLITADAQPETTTETQSSPASTWRDEVTLMLAPDAAAEVKLSMRKDDSAVYEWVVDQGHLNSDLHGDGAAKLFVSYRKGSAEAGNAGFLTAEFDGVHGWYWRNRSDVDVSVTLRVRGTYSEIKRVM